MISYQSLLYSTTVLYDNLVMEKISTIISEYYPMQCTFYSTSLYIYAKRILVN